MMTPIATVRELWRYPVKSMAGEEIKETAVYWYGFDGDRRYAFVQSENTSQFPWLTARELPQLVRYTPRFANPDDVVHGAVQVLTPYGRDLSIDAPELRQELATAWGKPIHLMQLNRGAFDSLCVSLVSTETLAALSTAFGRPLDSRRYRQNIIIEAATSQPYIEEGWANATLTFGERADSAKLLLARRISRCQMVNVDPSTGERDGRILRGIVAIKDECVGMYAWPQRVGTIRVGDEVFLSS